MGVEQTRNDILDSPAAGARVVRGTAVRTAGHFVGLGLLLLAAPFLTRELGVEDYGRYVTVGSLIALANILADGGLGTAALTEYAVRDERGRKSLISALVAVRLSTSVLAAVGVTLFSVIAGYDRTMVIGTALGGIALILAMAQQSYAIPLAGALRLELVTALGLLRQLLTVAGILALVGASAGLLAFFVLPIPVALVVLVTTLLFVSDVQRLRPSIAKREWRYLMSEMPAAVASTIGALFYRVALITTSLLATAEQTGYFAISTQVVDVFVAVAAITGMSALPILARAAETDGRRFAAGFQQLWDISLVLGLGTAFALVAGAEPIIAFIGGSAFQPAESVLRIQGIAVALSFIVMPVAYALWAIRAKRVLMTCNVVALFAAVGLTAALARDHGAQGAALGMLIAEGLLMLMLCVALFTGRHDLRPSLRTLGIATAGVALATGIVALPFRQIVTVALGMAAYAAVVVVFRAVPRHVWREVLSG